ncbi:hypothetical protein WJX74_002642 [Apatococcus lobatus]|uniref:Protein kinase domain-containing protein n=1 Tax=Apatococcus lobatus TaxID=904363 RepID=A0AAW1QWX6_9CHLO
MASQAKKTFGQITPWRSALCGRYSGFKQDRLVTLDLESEEALRCISLIWPCVIYACVGFPSSNGLEYLNSLQDQVGNETCGTFVSGSWDHLVVKGNAIIMAGARTLKADDKDGVMLVNAAPAAWPSFSSSGGVTPSESTTPDVYAKVHAFGGASCVTFSFTAADAGADMALADLAYAIDHPADPQVDQYAWCNTINCKQPRTIPLNASAGLYYFNLTALDPESAAFSWSFTLHPADSKACTGRQARAESMRALSPWQLTAQHSALSLPMLLTPGPVLWRQISDQGGAFVWGSITNASMLSGFLQMSARLSQPHVSVALHLLEQSELPAFHATNLHASAIYYMAVSHTASRRAADAGNVIADIVAAFSGASSCGKPQCPGEELLLDEDVSATGTSQPDLPMPPAASALAAANQSHHLSPAAIAVVIVAAALGLAASLAQLSLSAEEELALSSEPAERMSGDVHQAPSARVNFADAAISEELFVTAHEAELTAYETAQSSLTGPSSADPSSQAAANAMTAEINESLPEVFQDAWRTDLDELQLELGADGKPVQLGRGGSGAVFKGTLGGVRAVAVKIIHSRSSQQQKRFVREIAMLRACYDPSIIMFMGASIQPGRTILVMQYMEKGDLWKALQNDRRGIFRWHNRGRKVALEIAAGILYLHSKSLLHLDLKSPNVLLDDQHRAHVADVGLAQILSADQGGMVSYAASFMWAAPEQLQGLPCSKASDVYSLGVVLWELCTAEQPLLRQMRPLRVPQEAPAAIAQLITACCSQSPSDRPSIQEIVACLRS